MCPIFVVPSAVGSPTTTTKEQQQHPRWNYYGHHFSRDENRIKSSISGRGGLWQSNNGDDDDMGRPLLKKPSSHSSLLFGKAQAHTIALIYMDLYLKLLADERRGSRKYMLYFFVYLCKFWRCIYAICAIL